MLEFLLGRIQNLSTTGDFTTQTGNFTGMTAPDKRELPVGSMREFAA